MDVEAGLRKREVCGSGTVLGCLGDDPQVPHFGQTARSEIHVGTAVAARHGVYEIPYAQPVARIHTVAVRHGHESIDLDRCPYPWVGVAHLAGIGKQKRRQHDPPNADTELRCQLIFEIGPVDAWPVCVVVELL